MTLKKAFYQRGAVPQWLNSALFSGTTTSATSSDVDSTNGKIDITTNGGDILVFYAGYYSCSTADTEGFEAINLDGGANVAGVLPFEYPSSANFPSGFFVMARFTNVAPGLHTVKARHANISAVGTGTSVGELLAAEVMPVV